MSCQTPQVSKTCEVRKARVFSEEYPMTAGRRRSNRGYLLPPDPLSSGWAASGAPAASEGPMHGAG